MSYKKIIFSITLFILGVLLGLTATAQFRTTLQMVRSPNPLRPNLELKKTLEEMKVKQANLKQQINDLQGKIDSLEKQIKEEQKTSSRIIDELDKYKNFLGLFELIGEGVVIVLQDSQSYDSDNQSDRSEALVQATDLLDIINLLWAAGAEAIAINGERVIFTTSINSVGETILINNSPQNNPFTIMAIGNKEILKAYLKNEVYLSNLYKRQKKYQIGIDIVSVSELQIPAYKGSYFSEEIKLVKE